MCTERPAYLNKAFFQRKDFVGSKTANWLTLVARRRAYVHTLYHERPHWANRRKVPSSRSARARGQLPVRSKSGARRTPLLFTEITSKERHDDNTYVSYHRALEKGDIYRFEVVQASASPAALSKDHRSCSRWMSSMLLQALYEDVGLCCSGFSNSR